MYCHVSNNKAIVIAIGSHPITLFALWSDVSSIMTSFLLPSKKSLRTRSRDTSIEDNGTFARQLNKYAPILQYITAARTRLGCENGKLIVLEGQAGLWWAYILTLRFNIAARKLYKNRRGPLHHGKGWQYWQQRGIDFAKLLHELWTQSAFEIHLEP